MNSKALYNITYGLYLLTANDGEKDNGCIINTAIQTASNPPRLSIAVIQQNRTHDIIRATGEFNISAITDDAPFSLFQRFGMQSGRDVDKFDGFGAVEHSANGLYYLTQHANMFLSGKVVSSFDLGSHTVFIAELTDGEVLSSAAPCTYAYYQSDIKPKAKKPAKKSWVCSVCGYVHEGDSIPDDFICPICHHGVQDFAPAGGEVPAQKTESAVPAPAETPVKRWVCSICGYVHEGEEPPEQCPVCKFPREKFTAG